MINSRSLDDLDTEVKDLCNQHISMCRQRGIELLITSTYRDYESQATLYAVGRTINIGHNKLTDAPAGRSWHNFKCAYDFVPLIMGKCDWVARDPHTELLTPRWQLVIDLAKDLGLESASDWTTFKEDCHVQYRKVDNAIITIEEAKLRYDKSGSIFLS